MTFIEKTKRFLEPLTSNKWLTILSYLKFSMYGIHAIASVLIMKASLHAIEGNNIAQYSINIKIFIGLLILYFITAWALRTSDWPRLFHNLERWIYHRYIPMIIRLDNNYVESIGAGKMISILREGRTVWVDKLIEFLKETAKISLTGGFLIYLISQIHLSYALIVVGCLICMHILVIYVDTIAHKDRKVRTNEKGELTRKLVRIIMSRNEIIQNNSLKKEMLAVEESVQIIDDANFKINRSMFFIFNFVRVFAFGLRIGVLFTIGYGVFYGTSTVTEFATIMAMVIVFESFLFDSTDFYKNFTKDFSDIEKLWEVLDNGPMMKGYDSGLVFMAKTEHIEIRNVSYGYNETKIFSDFSLSIPYGKKTALVGPSGGGKTTLMKLIAGYLHPQNGSVSILGNILSKTALKTYYPHIGYLSQDPSVFDATIRENLMSAITDKDNTVLEPKLISALKLAHCDFVFDLEKGLDTEIGERGVRLSGGQKQRLAIAKIFLKNPEVILLDEPTSALDSFSEEAITEALNTLFQGRTVIIVAHRLQTVKQADDIIVLEGGQVIERGNHHELVKHKGTYNRMLELQSGF